MEQNQSGGNAAASESVSNAACLNGSGPLQGIRVLDLSRILAGPTCTQLLGDYGADIIKVERPGSGDDTRSWGPPYVTGRDGNPTGESAYYLSANRNKRSITIDPTVPEDLAALDLLVETADVFIQNFRPGVADRLNVGAARLQGINPRLVYASISGFGATGPDRDRPAFDTVAQAASGFLRLLVNPQHPRVVGPAVADAMTGFYTALGIMAALNERHTTGKGRVVETSMFEAMCHFNLDDFTHLLSAD